MGKLHTLVARNAAPACSPERVALAALIEKQGMRTAALNAALAAEARASARVDEAEQAHEAAERALEAAKAADAQALTAHAETGSHAAPARRTRELRADVQDAADALEAARSVHMTMVGRRMEAEQDAKPSLGSPVSDAIRDVLAPAVAAFVQETEDLQRKLVQHRIAIRLLWNEKLLAPNLMPAAASIMNRVALPDITGQWGTHDINGWPQSWEFGAGQEWLAARQALMSDADAPLPRDAGGV